MQTKWWGWGDLARSYPLEGKPHFWPFLESRLGSIPVASPRLERLEAIALPASRLEGPERMALEALVGPEDVTTLSEARIRHTFGKSYRDLWRMRQGDLACVPDAVVFPETHDEVQAILMLAVERGLKVIPFGGGTSVVGGVEVPPGYAEHVFLSLDLAKLDRVLELDEVSRTACLQAGMLGPKLEAALNARGYTLGHFPQSFEFSTLGGWLATRSAGQQSSKYGKIEEMVVSLKLATPQGTFETATLPAQATGPNLTQLLVGSEGVFGVITEATMKIHPVPRVRDYRGLLLPSFEAGVLAIQDLLRHELRPAVVRLSDAHETTAMFKLREAPGTALAASLQRLGRWVLSRGGTIDLEGRCLLLLGFEGDATPVLQAWEAAGSVLKRHDALSLGAGVGKAWFHSRFDLPYLRDTLLDRGVMVDTLETAGEWSQLLTLYRATDATLREAVAATGTPAFVMCHVSHVYHDGASLYFTFVGKQASGQELAQWESIKRAATDCLVKHQGALSHHHAVGRDHAPWMPDAVGPLGMQAIAALKASLDPGDQMNPGKLVLPSVSPVPLEEA